MARQFDDGATEYLERDSAPVAVAPFTISCWFNSDDIAARQALVWIGDKDVDNSAWVLQARGDVGGDPVVFGARQAGGFNVATSSTGFSANTWHHACGVETANNDRAVFIDGGSKGTDVTATTPAGADRVSIAREGDNTPSNYMSGAIAEVAIWNVALSDAEVALLAKGFSPLFIQPHNLVAYWPLIRDDDNDWIGGFDLAAFNTPTVATHPPLVVHPIRKSLFAFAPILLITPNTVLGQGQVFNLSLGTEIETLPDRRLLVITPGLAQYKVRLKDQDGIAVAEFDTWASLSFTHMVNQRGAIRFEINGDDSRNSLFVTDGQIEVWRRNQIIDLDWYLEWEGFFRTKNTLLTLNGTRRFVAYGFSYLDLARRAEIAWPPGSDEVVKEEAAETAMKQLVSENIGAAALEADGRLADNVMPGLSIEGDEGEGETWAASVDDENLGDILEDIALFTSTDSPVDFDIVGIGDALFEFRTYAGQRGLDRTKTNTDGNVPVTFGVSLGNMIVPVLSENRSTIANVIYAIGAGTDDTRLAALAQDNAELAQSPWNRIEKSVSGGSSSSGCNVNAQLLALAGAELEENKFDARLNFEVIQLRSSYYGKHYSWGDRITAGFLGQDFDKKIVDVRITVSENANGEDIQIGFADN